MFFSCVNIQYIYVYANKYKDDPSYIVNGAMFFQIDIQNNRYAIEIIDHENRINLRYIQYLIECGELKPPQLRGGFYFTPLSNRF